MRVVHRRVGDVGEGGEDGGALADVVDHGAGEEGRPGGQRVGVDARDDAEVVPAALERAEQRRVRGGIDINEYAASKDDL